MVLKPEVRVNKNGVPVTKHVRIDSRKNQQPTQYPAPQKQPSDRSVANRSHLIHKMREAMLVGKHGLTGLRPVADIYASLDELSDDTVEAFRDAIHERPSDGFAELLVGLLNQRSSDMEARYALTVNKLVEHRDENGGYDLGFLSLRVYKQVMSGLRSYRGFGYRMPQDILNQEDPNAVATAGLIRLTTRMLDDPEGCGIIEEKQSHGVKLDSTDLVKMVLERPEDADRIADAVAERQSTDATVIRDMLDSPSQSLRDGVL